MNILEVIRRPIVTEKSTMLGSLNQYAFEVSKSANKVQIKEAVEAAFGVTVLNVNTMMMRGKQRRVGRSVGRTADWKKAIVTLPAGQKIEVFEGI